MSQTFFSKMDPLETESKLLHLGKSKGFVTIWEKGNKDKFKYQVSGFIKDRLEVSLNLREEKFTKDQSLLCTFDFRGMSFFAEVVAQRSINGYTVLLFKNPLFKLERRSNYRLLTYPIFKVWAEFDLDKTYEGGKVINLKNRTNQTELFKSFLKIIDEKGEDESNKLKILIQDLSMTGMSLTVSGVEVGFFKKGVVFNNVTIRFSDQFFLIPQAEIIYVVDYLAHEKGNKKFKIGVRFKNLPEKVQDDLAKKINTLLHENDSNKEFEKFLK
jgi:hypothetical protein